MRGLGFLAIRPDDEWLDKAFLHSGRQMWGFSPPQLANTAWAFALLGLQPPREWLAAFCKRVRKTTCHESFRQGPGAGEGGLAWLGSDMSCCFVPICMFFLSQPITYMCIHDVCEV